MSTYTMIFVVLATLLTAVDFAFARNAFRKHEPAGLHLGFSALCAGAATMGYLISVSAGNPRLSSLASSLYFIAITWMLVSMTRFTYAYTGMEMRRDAVIVRPIMFALAIVDTAMMLVNVFTEVAIGYTRVPLTGVQLSSVIYEMKPLYVAHLVFTYLMVAFVLTTLIVKCLRTPQQYRNQYLLIILAIALIVAINAVFLFLDEDLMITRLDFSIFAYSCGLLICYWAAFNYREKDMLESLSMMIFQNIGQGIVLFDYTDRLVMANRKIRRMMPEIDFAPDLTGMAFVARCGIDTEEPGVDQRSFQCERTGAQRKILRCDYTRLRDRTGAVIGHLMVFTDESAENDILTGFPKVDAFRQSATENPFAFDHPTAAAVFDIVALSEINRVFGREVGDQRILRLARLLKEHMPEGTVFVRGHEAHLVAVCPGHTEEEIQGVAERIEQIANAEVLFGLSETSAGGMTQASRNVIDAIETASHALRIKQLLHRKTNSSKALTSLIRALKETDTDTAAHVQRTQKMGLALAHRVGLRDAQLAELRLLCLLHDIGKIGIPLEILNKPGKLTDQEWTVLRTHAEKGYQIALSSVEFRSIAPLILYHHERWDGKGYPEKLAGQDIPILSRLISIVDSYDAMVNNRSYRRGRSPEEAQEEIRRNAGTQFDPNLAREFLAMLAENPAIAEGERTGGEEVRVYIPAAVSDEVTGDTFPIPYSRYLLDLDERIVEVDDRFEEITGYRRGETVGKLSQLDLIPAGSRGFYMLQVNRAFSAGDIAYLKHQLLCRDGSSRWVVCYGKRYYDSAEKAFRSEILIFPATGADGLDRAESGELIDAAG